MKTCPICDKPLKIYLRGTIARPSDRSRTCGDKQCIDALRVKTTKQAERVCPLCINVFSPGSGRGVWCTACVPDSKWRARASKYGIGKKQWDHLLTLQNGKCALCTKVPTVVDHNHATGKVRGLLCQGCNSLLAGLDMHQSWLDIASEYVRAK